MKLSSIAKYLSASITTTRTRLQPTSRWAAAWVTGAALFGASGGWAQTAHFGGVQTTTAHSSYLSYAGVAVDPGGDVFVADDTNNQIVETTAAGKTIDIEIGGATPQYLALDSSNNLYVTTTAPAAVLKLPFSAGSYGSPTSIATNFVSPWGIAVDQSGNVFVVDHGGNAVYKLAPNGATYIQTMVIDTGFNGPAQLAVDASSHLFIADAGNDRVVEVSTAGRVLAYINGISSPAGVAVDAHGNLAIAGATDLTYEVPAGNSAYIPTVLATNFRATFGVTFDAAGNMYVNDSGAGRIIKQTPMTVNFGSVNVGATSSPLALAFVFDASGTGYSIQSLTQGMLNSDFNTIAGGTCMPPVYTAGTTCTLHVAFTPQHAGALYGAELIKDLSGNPLATAYMQGTGQAAQIAFAPVQTTIMPQVNSTAIALDGEGNVYYADGGNTVYKEYRQYGGYVLSSMATGFHSATAVAVDGAGNVYVVDTTNKIVVKETNDNTTTDPLYGWAYTPSYIGAGLDAPIAVAVDGAGNVYILDSNTVYKETLAGSTYVQSSFGSGLDASTGLAVDSAGNVYVADPAHSRVVKETPSGSNYTQTTVGSGLSDPHGVAVDAAGNVYIVDTAENHVVQEMVYHGGYIQTYIGSGLKYPYAVAVDGSGDMYIADTGNVRVVMEAVSQPPTLNFPNTVLGQTSSAIATTITNLGNQPLILPAPKEGDNPSTATNFGVGSETSCPVLDPQSSSETIAAGESCTLSYLFAPTLAGTVKGSSVLTDNNLGASAATQTISLSGVASQATPVIDWAVPTAITYGAKLSATQFDVTASVAGAFTYSPALGTILPAGIHTLSVTFTPADTVDYKSTTATMPLTVNQALPKLTWGLPAAITYGARLSATQLNATANVPGAFAYTPAAGQVLNAGSQTLSAKFTPTDAIDYQTTTITVPLTVNKATPMITWTPAPLPYGTGLSADFNATANVAGSFTYAVPTGPFPVGSYTATSNFHPTDSLDYNIVQTQVTIKVVQATPTITWATPAPITHGTALSATQLDATAKVAGSFAYNPQAGTVLATGSHTLSTTFTPTDTVDYKSATAAVVLVVH